MQPTNLVVGATGVTGSAAAKLFLKKAFLSATSFPAMMSAPVNSKTSRES